MSALADRTAPTDGRDFRHLAVAFFIAAAIVAIAWYFGILDAFLKPTSPEGWGVDESFVVLAGAAIGFGVFFIRERRGLRAEITQRLRTEQALRESEERFRRLVEVSPEPIFVHRGDVFRFVNNAAAALLGAGSPDDIIGRPILDVVHPDYHDMVNNRVQQMIWEGKRVPTVEQKFVRLDGAVVDVEVASIPLVYEGQMSIQAIVRDITERKRGEKALRDTNELLSQSISELEQRNREAALLDKMGDLLQSCLSVEEVHHVVAHSARNLFPGGSGCLFMLSSSRNMLEAVATWGDIAPGERILAPDECWALRRGRLHSAESGDALTICRHNKELLAPGYICVPMMAAGETLGVLYLQTGTEVSPPTNGVGASSTEAKRRLAVTLAERASLALANMKLRQVLRDQAIRDPLTGLFNRRYMEVTLERELRRAERRGSPLGIVMLDIDNFKRFNDVFGHAAGDCLLSALGSHILVHTRGEDVACRYGGEEFTLILPDCPLEAARRRAEELRVSIQNLTIEHRQQVLGSITVSSGVAAYPQHGTSGEALLRAADAALYQAKSDGRNRVVTLESNETTACARASAAP